MDSANARNSSRRPSSKMKTLTLSWGQSSAIEARTVVRTTLNGRTVQESPISQMIFSIPRLIAHISRFAALEQGDVISTGTPEGVGPLKIGDLIEVEIDGIGKLRNICAE